VDVSCGGSTRCSPLPSDPSHLKCDVTRRRTQYISSRRLWLLRPLLRYSFTVNAYVFRVCGLRWGPLFRPRGNSGLLAAPAPDELARAEEFNDVPVSGPKPETGTGTPTDRRPTLTIVRNHEAADQSIQGERQLMRPFSMSNQCPKCGFGDASIVYHDPETGEKGCDPGEHIHRECLTCGYPWSDACLALTEHQLTASTSAGQAS
jgi:hypothetical protein